MQQQSHMQVPSLCSNVSSSVLLASTVSRRTSDVAVGRFGTVSKNFSTYLNAPLQHRKMKEFVIKGLVPQYSLNLLPQIQFVLFVACLTPQQHVSVSQGRIWSVMPHWDRSCRSKFLSHPYWYWANQSQRWPQNARCLAGSHWSVPFLSHRKSR